MKYNNKMEFNKEQGFRPDEAWAFLQERMEALQNKWYELRTGFKADFKNHSFVPYNKSSIYSGKFAIAYCNGEEIPVIISYHRPEDPDPKVTFYKCHLLNEDINWGIGFEEKSGIRHDSFYIKMLEVGSEYEIYDKRIKKILNLDHDS